VPRFATATLLLAALSLAVAPRPSGAAPIGFQVELQGVGSQLGGNTGIAGIHSVTDLYAPQFGFMVGATYGFTDHLVFGVRSGEFAEKQDVTDIAREVGSLSAPLTANAELQVIPTHALLQYRAKLARKFGVYDEFGVGVSSFKQNFEVFRSGQSLVRTAARQLNLSFLIGGGGSWDYQTAFSVIASFDVLVVPSANGEVWSEGHNPQFFMFALGIRYPRR